MDKRQVAAMLKRAPWVGAVAQRFYRRWQPWVTSGVVGAVFNPAGQVLLVEHVFHPKSPWGLPGGWMSRHEEPEETVRREVREETSLHIEPIKPLLITIAPRLPNHLDIAFLCYAPQSENITLCAELLAYQWIEPQHAMQIMLTPFHRRVMAAALHEIQAGSLAAVVEES